MGGYLLGGDWIVRQCSPKADKLSLIRGVLEVMRYTFFIGDDIKYLHMGYEEILRLLYRLDVWITIPLWELPLVQYHNQGR